MQAIALIFILAILTEGLVEYFGSPIPAPYKRYVAAVVGVVVCVIYNADLLVLFGAQATVPFVGSVVTGFVVGRGSNYLNDLVSRLRLITAPVVPVADVEMKA